MENNTGPTAILSSNPNPRPFNTASIMFTISGIEDVLKEKNTDVRIFGKPSIRPYRRMAVALVYDDVNTDMDELRKRAKTAADKISIN